MLILAGRKYQTLMLRVKLWTKLIFILGLPRKLWILFLDFMMLEIFKWKYNVIAKVLWMISLPSDHFWLFISCLIYVYRIIHVKWTSFVHNKKPTHSRMHNCPVRSHFLIWLNTHYNKGNRSHRALIYHPLFWWLHLSLQMNCLTLNGLNRVWILILYQSILFLRIFWLNYIRSIQLRILLKW